ncbi:MAG TPA: hypothetical protein P5234_03615 [Thermoanaerobaculaceae bacterium]|nr:hypothetical protein [Thermoanaerobaculaceae bacterium]HRS15320.1 hypothetical protein [Thermoanaerobaculaceae bacterium]
MPRLAYLPPFACIGPREEHMVPAARKRWIGRGLAGAVLRNLLYGSWKRNCDARENRKQVLLATDSTSILSEVPLDRVFRMESGTYLRQEGDRVSLFLGLGSAYAPRLDQLKRCKRLFMHDGPSDLEILQAWARTLGLAWLTGLVCWRCTRDRQARETLFDELREEIPGLRAISLQDRDDYPLGRTAANVTFDNLPEFNNKGLGLRRWRRRNIENYLLHPAAIARAAGRTEVEIRSFLQDVHGLSVTSDFNASDCPQTLANTDGKEILAQNARSVQAKFIVTYKHIAAAMEPAEIPEDARTLLSQLAELCGTAPSPREDRWY